MKNYSRYLLLPLIAVIGALTLFNLFAQVTFRLEAVQANISIRTFQNGYTVVRVPPVGEVRANTHKTPLSIRITLENIYLDPLKKLLTEEPEQRKMVDGAKPVLLAALRKLAALSLALGCAGGVLGLVIVQRRNPKELLTGGLIGLLTVAVLLFGTYRSYDPGKFQHPEYDGMIKAAPWMIGLVGESVSTVNTWGKQMRGMANNLYGLFQRVDSLQAMAPGDGEIKILHVSDIHNNPASFNVIDQLVKTFRVDLIIDSGDMSDLGTPLEAAALERVRKLQVPYFITPGNHETTTVIQELHKVPNIKVLNGKVEVFKGLTVAGIHDPFSLRNDWQPPSVPEIADSVIGLREIIRRSGKSPDIVVAHNPEIASEFWGDFPVVLTGHNHQYKIGVKHKSVFINAGTSGASGIGALKSQKEIPYTFVLLHFDRTAAGIRLKYTDTIRISNRQSGYSLERKIYSELYNGGTDT